MGILGCTYKTCPSLVLTFPTFVPVPSFHLLSFRAALLDQTGKIMNTFRPYSILLALSFHPRIHRNQHLCLLGIVYRYIYICETQYNTEFHRIRSDETLAGWKR